MDMKRLFVLAIVSIGLGLNVDGRAILPVMQPSLETRGSICIYDSLIGMIYHISSNRLTNYYDYNERGRLQLIRDYEDNILQHYEYHYYNDSQGRAQ